MSLILTCFKDITSKLDQPVVFFSTLILSVTTNPDLHGLINLISIANFCVIYYYFLSSVLPYIFSTGTGGHSDECCEEGVGVAQTVQTL